MDAVYDNWWKAWSKQKLVDFIPQPVKGSPTNCSIKVGDIVLFLKAAPEQHFGEPVWKIGRVTEAPVSKQDGITRTVTIEYKNSNERVFRSTTRAVRSLAIVHSEEDLDVVQRLEAASTVAGLHPLHEGEAVPLLIDKPPQVGPEAVAEPVEVTLDDEVLLPKDDEGVDAPLQGAEEGALDPGDPYPDPQDGSVAAASPAEDMLGGKLPHLSDDGHVGAHVQGLLDGDLDLDAVGLPDPLTPSKVVYTGSHSPV